MQKFGLYVILCLAWISYQPIAITQDIVKLEDAASISKGVKYLPRGSRGKHGHKGHHGPEGREGHEGHRGHKGKAGANGANGATGATGVAGVTGPTGATGPTGNYVPIYGSVFIGTGSADVFPTNPIPFTLVGPLNGVLFNNPGPSNTYEILTTAIYRVSYALRVIRHAGNSTAAINLVNIGIIPNTTATATDLPGRTFQPLAFEGDLLLNAGDKIQVVCTSGEIGIASDNAGSSFTIIKVGTL